MKRILLTIYSLIFPVLLALADYSDRGRPWDADDNYDSSRGLWFAVGVVIVLIVIGIGAFAKHTWDNHKSQVKDGFGIIAFFGGCILLFLAGKTCSESRPKNNDNAVNVRQVQQPSSQPAKQYQEQPHIEFYYEICPSCNGDGFLRCSHCSGTGFISIPCNSCGGKGRWLVTNSLNFTHEEFCTDCLGQGSKQQLCTFCSPMYVEKFGTTARGLVRCQHCNGSGRIQKSRTVYY